MSQDAKDHESSHTEQAKEYIGYFYEKLEQFAKSANESFKRDVLPELEKKTKEKPLQSVFLSFLAGFVMCLLIGRKGQRD